MRPGALAAAESALIDERRPLSAGELAELAALPAERTADLAAVAHQVRLAWCGPTVEVEGIVSARTGGCSEDCSFCSQSSHFNTLVAPLGLMALEDLLEAARQSAAAGASEFCMVVAVRGPDDRLLARVEEAIGAIHAATGLAVAASLGILTPHQARRLADAGLHRYNHNLETARSFFDQVVTTHTWEERMETCRLVGEVGMELCCGAILGLGETDSQRLELLGQLAALSPTEVPVNFLNPRPGTPLAHRPLMAPMEAIRWIALFRLALPGVILRYAGGREVTLRQLQALGLTSGINALIVGNYLTTLGRAPAEDLAMLADLAMPVGSLSSVI
ncbi:MAG: biotin synthase BioB [Acidimicrobiales bacterium]